MLAPLAYERVGTFSDPSEVPEGRLGSGLVDVAGPGLEVVDAGPTTVGDRKLHPLHWLVDGHWLGRWRTPRLLKIWRYGAGSIVAFVTSVVTVYVCFSWIGLGASTSAIIAFFAGAIPNWVLNRRWAWQQRGREGVARETSLYVMVSIISLVTSTAVTKLAATQADHVSHLTKDFLVTGSYTFSIVVLTGLKYLAYDKLVFVDRSGARRSRHQVPSTTEQNRTP
jgi:putative flippase GtrA